MFASNKTKKVIKSQFVIYWLMKILKFYENFEIFWNFDYFFWKILNLIFFYYYYLFWNFWKILKFYMKFFNILTKYTNQ
jgi:hypothetical protein